MLSSLKSFAHRLSRPPKFIQAQLLCARCAHLPADARLLLSVHLYRRLYFELVVREIRLVA